MLAAIPKNKNRRLLMWVITSLLVITYFFLHNWIEKQAPWIFWIYFACSVAFSGYFGILVYIEKYLISGNFQEAIEFPTEVFTQIFIIGDHILKTALFLFWDMFFQNILIITKVLFYLGLTYVFILYLKKLKGVIIGIIVTYVMEKYFPNLSEIQHICWNHVLYLVLTFAISLMMLVVFKVGKEEGLKESDKILETFERRRNNSFSKKNKEKLKYKEEDFNCKICLTEKALCFGQNCLHLVACEECVQNLEDKCPVCRIETEFISLYI